VKGLTALAETVVAGQGRGLGPRRSVRFCWLDAPEVGVRDAGSSALFAEFSETDWRRSAATRTRPATV